MSSYFYSSSPLKQTNLVEKEKNKILIEKEEIISKFVQKYIIDETGHYRLGIKSKIFKDNSKYEGELTLNDVKIGKGIYYYSNGDRYLGEWYNDTFNGKGIYIFSFGERYEGNLINGLKQGKGMYNQ